MKSLLMLTLVGFVALPGIAADQSSDSGNLVMADDLAMDAMDTSQDMGVDLGNDVSMDVNMSDMGLDANMSDMGLDANMTYSDAAEAPELSPTPPNLGNWTVREDRSGCSITTVFEDFTRMTLAYDSYDRHGFLHLRNLNWRSIVSDRTYFLTVEMPPFPLRTLRGSGMWIDDMPGFAIPFEGLNFLTEFMEAETIYISNGRNRLGAFDLQGSYAAAVELARCNRRVLSRVPRDPFAE